MALSTPCEHASHSFTWMVTPALESLLTASGVSPIISPSLSTLLHLLLLQSWSHTWSHEVMKPLPVQHLCFLFILISSFNNPVSPSRQLTWRPDSSFLRTLQCCSWPTRIQLSNPGQFPVLTPGNPPDSGVWFGTPTQCSSALLLDFTVNGLAAGGAEAAERPCGFAFDNVHIVSKLLNISCYCRKSSFNSNFVCPSWIPVSSWFLRLWGFPISSLCFS